MPTGYWAKRHCVDPSDNPAPRAWDLTSYAHACGFSIAVTRPISSMSVYRIIDLCPIDVEKVRELSLRGEPIPEQDQDAECEFLGLLFSGPAAWEVLARNKESILEADFYDATHRKAHRSLRLRRVARYVRTTRCQCLFVIPAKFVQLPPARAHIRQQR
jgi:hypothetical protein